ncbi:hypothetical protein GIB67_015524 [Kingdonia uniflora]|uniref:Uncharacterized protein n=1 Tax=Kingdonia uniflora TaxID=39325 RepID=A0A7J7LA94_9MAGN|nr:hypothetical protein GIB67_015524 [Kingdonia uniflora]
MLYQVTWSSFTKYVQIPGCIAQMMNCWRRMQSCQTQGSHIGRLQFWRITLGGYKFMYIHGIGYKSNIKCKNPLLHL